MLLRHSLGLETEAAAVERAVEAAIVDGLRTADIALPGRVPIGSEAAGKGGLERLGRS